jgi:hypothetical protein
MAARTTPFPDGPRILVFREVERIMRADAGLKPVKVWSTWDGTMNDAMGITPSMCPYIQLTPLRRPSGPLGVGRRSAVLGIRITAAVSGTIADDLVNFWDAIEDALGIDRTFQQSTVYCTLQSHKAYFHQFTEPGLDAWSSPQNPPVQFLQGSGLLELRISRSA